MAPSARDLAMRNPSEKKEESFKPAPSWSGKSVQDAASVDNNTLYDALKRRAKDVSRGRGQGVADRPGVRSHSPSPIPHTPATAGA